MKPLALILVLATIAQAQSIAEFARKERERQAHTQSLLVITSETARTFLPAQPATAEATTTLPIARTAPAPPATPVVELVKKYSDEVARLRTRIRDLQDEEVRLQLQVNWLTNQFFAPRTNESARRKAQDGIGQTHSQLTMVRAELEQIRRLLLQMEIQGPPRLP